MKQCYVFGLLTLLLVMACRPATVLAHENYEVYFDPALASESGLPAIKLGNGNDSLQKRHAADLHDLGSLAGIQGKKRANVRKPTAQTSGDGNMMTLTVTLPGVEYPNVSVFNRDYIQESNFDGWMAAETPNAYTFQVPEDTYDVVVGFSSEIEGFEGWGYLVREDLEITEDMAVTFSTDELTERLDVEPLLMDGNPVKLIMKRYLDHEPWIEFDESERNAWILGRTNLFFKEGTPFISEGGSIYNYIDPEAKSQGYHIMTNKVSDKYWAACVFQTQTLEGEWQVSSTTFNNIRTGTTNNYIASPIAYPFPTYATTPLYETEGVENNHSSLGHTIWFNDAQWGGYQIYTNQKNPDVKVAIQPNSLDLRTVLIPGSVQYEETVRVDIDDEYYYEIVVLGDIFSLPVIREDGGWKSINQNHDMAGYKYSIPADGGIAPPYPGVEPYCFDSTQITSPSGNATPITVLMFADGKYDYETNEYARFIEPQAYIGRYGEVRNCDDFVTRIQYFRDDNLVFDNASGLSIFDWCVENTVSGGKGMLKGVIDDGNILIDGELRGRNLTTFVVDENNIDYSAPTPQMLTFKNSRGAITDRFNSASDGVLEFSAGDFNWVVTDNQWDGYFTVDEAEVLVEYAPYGEETWQPIEVEEVPEYFYMPGFGYFYRGSLGCVDQPSSNGWYDLRMTLTDKAGNRTVEHISPAFKIGEGSGVKSTPVDGVNVWVTDGQIRTNCADIVSIEVFTLDGRLVAKTGGTAHASLSVDGLTGALLVRLTTASGAVTTHKLLL